MRLAEIVRTLERRYPPDTAESWDAVGLVVGDPDQEVSRVIFAVDPVEATVREALDWGADLLVSHHPLLLRPVHSIAATGAKGRVVHTLVRGECALYTAHTNADAARGGVAEALARAVGLTESRPLVPAPTPALDALVTYVPVGGAAALVEALAAAGAGALGDYSNCAWTVDGIGQFLPGPGAHPTVGVMGALTHVSETRIEMVVPRGLRDAVVRALRAAHPYEEPAFTLAEMAPTASPTGAGRIGDLPEALTLGAFARRVADTLPATAQGVRVSGDLGATVRTIAVCGGSGDSFLSAARGSGADVYLTADLRHHPTSEAREAVRNARPYLVDVAHWASEWPWLRHAAAALESDVAAAGGVVRTRVSTLVTDPWTARFDPTPAAAAPHAAPSSPGEHP
jgi:dinuclear metal center YbgI/SA1388 family protein